MPKAAKPQADGERVEKPAPSLSLSDTQAKIDADKAATLERVLETAPTASPAAKTEETPAAPEAPAELTDDAYMEWWNAQPENMRARFGQNVISAYAHQLEQHYGPEVSQVLAEVKDDPKLAKIFNALTAKEKREWLAETALSIYDDPRFASTPASEDAPDPKYAALEAEVNELKTARQRDAEQKSLESYQNERRDEYQAFLNKFPALAYDASKVRFSADGTDIVPASGVDKSDPDFKKARRVFAIVNRAEEQSRKANRKISYADVGIEMMDMWDAQEATPPPRPVPNVSTKEIPKPQAPRTKVEVRRNIAEAVGKHGNIVALQRALRS